MKDSCTNSNKQDLHNICYMCVCACVCVCKSWFRGLHMYYINLTMREFEIYIYIA